MIEIILKASWKGIINKNTLTIPCSTNCYFSGQYLSCKTVPELLKVYYEVNISHIFLNPFWRYDSCLSFAMPFHELKTTMLCQNDDLLNYAVNCEIFRKIITRAKYFGKHSKLFITKRSKTYYKIRQVFYYKTREIFITKLCNLFYYKANCFSYKTWQVLQNAPIITKCGATPCSTCVDCILNNMICNRRLYLKLDVRIYLLHCNLTLHG